MTTELRVRDLVKITGDPANITGRILNIDHGIATVKWRDKNGTVLPHRLTDLRFFDRPTNLSEIGF